MEEAEGILWKKSSLLFDTAQLNSRSSRVSHKESPRQPSVLLNFVLGLTSTMISLAWPDYLLWASSCKHNRLGFSTTVFLSIWTAFSPLRKYSCLCEQIFELSPYFCNFKNSVKGYIFNTQRWRVPHLSIKRLFKVVIIAE